MGDIKVRYTVETMRDGKAETRTDVQAGSMNEAAEMLGPVKAGLGREPTSGEWIRVTEFVSGRTNWFRARD
ncbi:hypothetical protein FJ422_29740 [Mesorhizobium sp. B2-6-3]|uniref:hypothetical protein n=1 Tax=Mesorhizobium sp. B2-6-3 TaxID=2589914 RepID=UPI00112610FA|nr:hypothetical protein [Mesorhizobium sp. B2-6-3]TPJ76892.1 hypothetical protein FJ422_29740 [Mesorhizobium sp. B2-6-3]